MKHRALLLAVSAAVGVFLLTACTSSEEEIARDVRTESSGNAGAADDGSADGAADQQEVSADTGDGSGASDTSDGQTQDGVSEDTSSQTETGAPEEPQTEAVPADAGAAPVEDIWSGTFTSDQETVTISLLDANSFSFSFANSGISSTAEIDGTQAIYRGDDYHVVVFEMNEGVLHITVSSEEDFDASASPLNGTYVRQTVTSDTEWGEEET